MSSTTSPPVLSEFVAGACRPSPVAAFIALLLVIGVLAVSLIVVSPDAVARAGRMRLAAHSEDYDAIVTSDLLAFTRGPRPSPTLVVLGGSTTRASLLEDDLRTLVHDLAPGGGVLKLCTSRQSLWESLVLAEHLPRPLKGTAVIGVGPSLFAMNDEVLERLVAEPRLGIRSASLEEAQAARGLRVRAQTGVYALDNAPFLLARRRQLLAAAFGLPSPAYVDSGYLAETAPVSARGWRTRAAVVAPRYQSVDANWSSNVVLLDRLIDTLTGAGLRIVLVETPVNPRFISEHDVADAGTRHMDRMRAYAAKRGVPYVVLNEAARLEEADFFDWAHLRSREAARRCAEALRGALAQAGVS